jgi:hypothetical protein
MAYQQPFEGSGISHGPDKGIQVSFNWRDHQLPDTIAVGSENDTVSWHGGYKEDLEALMDKIAARTAGTDFLQAEGDPLTEMIRWGETEKIVTSEEAGELIGMYGPHGSQTYH